MKEKYISAHMNVAHVYSKLSYCVRRKVGCIIVDGDRVVSIGYNGTPPGDENVCEIDGVTKPEVIHAEDNALRKLNFKAHGMSLFVTTAPCKSCADLIKDSGIAEVFYNECYNNTDGIDYLQSVGIPVRQIDLSI